MLRSLIKVFCKLSYIPTIIHFEIPADDLERSKKFYSEMFGWKFEKFTLLDGMDYLKIPPVMTKGTRL